MNMCVKIEYIIAFKNIHRIISYLKREMTKKNFYFFYDKLKPEEVVFHTSERDLSGLENYLVQDIGMNEKRIQTSFKKFHNNYK